MASSFNVPTPRPFFASFFGAFRARTSPTFQAKSSTASSLPTSAHVATTQAVSTAANSRSITSSNSPLEPTQQQTSAQSTIQAPSSNKPANTPFSPATFTSTSPGHNFYHPHTHARSPGSSSPVPHNANLSVSPPHHTQGSTTPLTRGRQRRGSESSNSSGGFMDALNSNGNAEKWYIGGRTAGGDERFYRMGLVTAGSSRGTSLDRLSL